MLVSAEKLCILVLNFICTLIPSLAYFYKLDSGVCDLDYLSGPLSVRAFCYIAPYTSPAK